MSQYPDEPDGYRSVTDLLERPPVPINWNLLDAEHAEIARHDELVWELSALHCHWLSCYHESASPSAPINWMREFAEARGRLRDWVSICGTRLDGDRPTR